MSCHSCVEITKDIPARENKLLHNNNKNENKIMFRFGHLYISVALWGLAILTICTLSTSSRKPFVFTKMNNEHYTSTDRNTPLAHSTNYSSVKTPKSKLHMKIFSRSVPTCSTVARMTGFAHPILNLMCNVVLYKKQMALRENFGPHVNNKVRSCLFALKVMATRLS